MQRAPFTVEATPKVETIKFTKEGQERSMRKQTLYFHIGDVYPLKFVVGLSDHEPPYDPSKEYTLDPSSFHTGKYDDLSIGRVALVERAAK